MRRPLREIATYATCLLLPAVALGQAAPGFPQLPPPPRPPLNPVTAAKAALGKALFWDEQLSSTLTMACATCHIPAAGGSDPRSRAAARPIHPGSDGVFGTGDDVVGSPGVPANMSDGSYTWDASFGLLPQVTGRKAPSMINAAYSGSLFWDGRAGEEFRDPLTDEIVLPFNAALESQVLGPPLSSVEMAHMGRDWADITGQLETSQPLALAESVPRALAEWIAGRGYPALFQEAFGAPDVTPSALAMAVATYERTLFSNESPIDFGTLTPEEQRGLLVFQASNCDDCHGPPVMSDNRFHYIGVRPPAEDAGRFAVTGDPDDFGKLRSPNLRNVALRGPYFHHGRFDTLEEVVDFYDRGGDFDAPNKDFRIRPLNLTPQQRADLLAFLDRPLTDPRVANEDPPFDRPRLFSESSRAPAVSGAGVAGSGGFVPQPVAIEPPMLGNPSFTVGLYAALGGANATLVIDDSDPGTASLPTAGSFAFVSVPLSGVGDGHGHGSASLMIPDDPAQAGRRLFGRWYVTDAGAPGGIAVSPLIDITLFAPRSIVCDTGACLFADGFESGDTGAWSRASGIF